MRTENVYSQRLPRGFTLIEILVTIGIILVLATVLLAVGSTVRKNSQVSATRAELHALAGIVDQFEHDANQVLPLTLYTTTSGGYTVLTPSAGTPNFVELLYYYPATKDQLVNLLGAKLKINAGAVGTSAILDSFGNPINFFPEKSVPPSGTWTAATREYLRSSGPDNTTDWSSESAPSNADDVLSFEAAH